MRIAPFKLERFFAKYEFEVPYLLCASDCESLTIRELLAFEPDAAEQFQRVWLGYTESLGHPELRRSIANIYQQQTPEQILVHSGAEEAIFLFMNALLEPGDHVIVHDPCYQSLRDIAASIGCNVTKWTAQEKRNWALDLNALEQQIRPTTKAIILNCPHNPTGYLMPLNTFNPLIEICRKYGIVLFSDEVYRGLEYDEHDRLPAACDLYERAVSLGVMSKTYGLAGLRIGWIATQDREIYRAMAALKDYTTICSSAPSEYLATFALRHEAAIAQRNREIIGQNMARLREFFNTYRHLFAWNMPHAGPIAFPRILFSQDVERFCHDLAEKKGVLLLPGTLYDFDNTHFRIGFGRKNMPEALTKLEEYLRENL